MKNWPTQQKDMYIARLIMEEYAQKKEAESLGLFEVVVNETEKSMDFQLADWVFLLAQQFNAMYGAEQGDYVTRQVISQCLIQGQTIH